MWTALRKLHNKIIVRLYGLTIIILVGFNLFINYSLKSKFVEKNGTIYFPINSGG